MRRDSGVWNPTPSVGLPNEYLYGFVAISALYTRIPRGLMASTDDAVYLSRDDGNIWSRASSGLPRRAHCGDLRYVERRLGVFLVFWIGDRIEEVAVTPGAADILWRAASGCLDETRIDDAGHGVSDAFDADRVLPAIYFGDDPKWVLKRNIYSRRMDFSFTEAPRFPQQRCPKTHRHRTERQLTANSSAVLRWLE